MAHDLIDFLRAQMAEDERVALASMADSEVSGWRQDEAYSTEARIDGADGMIIYDEGGHTAEDAEHIVRWQPDRVLAEVKAKRAVLDLLERNSGAQFPNYEGGYQSGLEDAAELLAQPFARRPGWRDEWSVGD